MIPVLLSSTSRINGPSVHGSVATLSHRGTDISSYLLAQRLRTTLVMVFLQCLAVTSGWERTATNTATTATTVLLLLLLLLPYCLLLATTLFLVLWTLPSVP
jgi:hypothetical protein